jgi:hypothetical protein
MSERRPHWDDDLIRAVIDAGGKPPPPNQLSKDHAYRVIAAVEDWQDTRKVPLQRDGETILNILDGGDS